MIFRLVILLAVITSSYAKDDSWYSKIYLKPEIGMFVSNFTGTHTTIDNDITSFQGDLGYSKGTSASYFGLEIQYDNIYVPNIEIGYVALSQEQNIDLQKKVSIVNFDFNGLITTRIDNEILNVILSYEVKTKGQRIPFLWWRIYPGDVKYNMGVNIKRTDWLFQLIDRENTTSTSKFVRVESLLPLPYLGIRYYYYRFSPYAHISAISIGDAKSINYEVGVDLKIMQNLYFSASYMHEYFEATEKEEMIKFKTAGNKFSIKYRF